MRIGIIGYKGFVGSAFYKVFSSDKKCEVVGIGREEYSKLIGEHFDIIINANGNSSKILAERDPKKDFEMNVITTLNSLFDFVCDHYVYISTIDVYSRKDNRASTKEDTTITSEGLSNYGCSKYFGELIAKKYAKRWMILRLGGMIGEGMKKGPVFDILNLHKLFVSSKSRFQFINTNEVANTAKLLIEKGIWNETYNIVGDGNMELSEIAKLAGVKLMAEGKEIIVLDATCDKLKRETRISSTTDTVKSFLTSRQNRN